MERISSLEFGSRTLNEETDVFEHNAWYYKLRRDQVEMDAEMEQEALKMIEKQRQSKLNEEQVEKYDTNPASYWNEFYTKNTNRFFKDRHWLKIEFPELFDIKQDFRICEIGCGAGNTVFPFLQETRDKNVFAFACDYSSEAVQVVKSNPDYDESKVKALVFDITATEIPKEIEPESLDVCICIFVLSAIHPRDWKQAADNIYRMLKPGGLLLFRDYGRYDLAQLRFKGGRMLQDNFYIRGDGTRVYFFTNEEVASMFSQFEVIQNSADQRLIVNRSRKLKMFRCWLQGKFRKPIQ